MSVWRQKAMECLPKLKAEFENKGTTIFDVFIELLPATIQAHKQNNQELLKKYYAFAEWCIQQKEKDLWNATGISIYEHLGDQEKTYSVIHLWVKKNTYEQIRGLLELRIDKMKIKKLDLFYFRKSK